MFVSTKGPRHPDRQPSHRLIRLSTPLLSGESDWEIYTTLAHEMIHQWQFDVLKRHANHGKDFHRKMKEMNRDGLGITIHHSMEDAVRALCKYTWCCKKCGRTYHRQRRTIRPRRHFCGRCGGVLRESKLTQPARKDTGPKPVHLPSQNPETKIYELLHSTCVAVLITDALHYSSTSTLWAGNPFLLADS